MKLLFTGDWQATWNNLDKIRKVVEEIHHLIDREKIDGVVHTGDVKHHFNPIDGRVAVEVVNRLSSIQKRVPVFINKGNHDQFSTASTADSWLPLLQAAGLTCFDGPGKVDLPGGNRLLFLPYASNEQTIEDAKALAKEAGKTSVLVFHCGLKDAKLNNSHTYKEEDALPVAALLPDRYQICIGGHFHLCQEVAAKVWYAGSPFACDWGEANQSKGYLLYTFGEPKPRFIASKIPGWYDPKVSGFKPPSNWEGSSVRISVPVRKTQVNVPLVLAEAKKDAERKYKGASITIIPSFEEDQTDKATIEEDSTDAEVIQEYLNSKDLSSQAPGTLEALKAYLLYSLGRVSDKAREKHAVELESLEAENILCFEKVSIDFKKPRGLRLISGRNEDWPGGRSNGTGKTTYLQLLIIAWFGESLKGQKADALIRRNASAKDPAFVRLKLRSADGKQIEILRSRRPRKTLLLVDGEDQCSGMGEIDTQRRIEQVTGVTWEALCNALYIDQGTVNRLLTAKDSERKAIFGEFLNYERFDKALKFLKKEASLWETETESFEEAISKFRVELRKNKEFVSELKTILKKERARKNRDKAELKAKLSEVDAQASKHLLSYKKFKNQVEELERQQEAIQERLEPLQRSIQEKERELAKLGTIRNVCPTCGNKIDTSKAEAHRDSLSQSLASLKKKAAPLEEQLSHIQDEHETLSLKENTSSNEYQEAAARLKFLHNQMLSLSSSVETKDTEAKIEAYRREVEVGVFKLRRLKRDLSLMHKQGEFYRLAVEAFSRDGIPPLLIGKTCPRLNNAALYYSELFSGGQIKVEFEPVGEDIRVNLINENGGELLRDQSTGETRVASLIVSFALREILSPLSVLIADEPGMGLDEPNLIQFAAGLRELESRFRTVMVTTHLPVLLAELSDAHQVEIIKKNGVSRAIVKQCKSNGLSSPEHVTEAGMTTKIKTRKK